MGFDISITFSSVFNSKTGEAVASAPVIPKEYRKFLYTCGNCWSQIVQDFDTTQCTADYFYDHLPEYEDLPEKDELDQEEYDEFRNAMKWFAEWNEMGAFFQMCWTW